MRSTITLYCASSPITVPPSFTNSAVMPSFLPSSFTLSMNAGGKLYSRPQSIPIFMVYDSFRMDAQQINFSLHTNRVMRRPARQRRTQLEAKHPRASPQRCGAPQPASRQSLCTRATAARRWCHAENSPEPGPAPFVFFNQRAVVHAEAHVARVQPMQLHHDGLVQRREGDGFIHARHHIKNAKFQSAKRRVRPHVPPDFLGVVYAVQPHQQLHIILILIPRIQMVGNSGAREPAKHRSAE